MAMYPSYGRLDPSQRRDVAAATNLIDDSIRTMEQIPYYDQGNDRYLHLRQSAYDSNMRAQNHLERHFGRYTDPSVVNELRRADALLENVTWHLSGNDRPNGQRGRIDIPQGVTDSQYARRILVDMLDRSGRTDPYPPGGALGRDAASAADLIRRSLDNLTQIPAHDAGNSRYDGLRRAAWQANIDAQPFLERHGELRGADANLERATWLITGKVPPSGGRGGIDIRGAIDLTQRALSDAASYSR